MESSWLINAPGDRLKGIFPARPEKNLRSLPILVSIYL